MSGLRKTLRKVDELVCKAQLAVLGDRPGIMSFLFHAVSENGSEEIDRVVAPGQTLSVASLDGFVSHFKRSGYRFVSPEDIREGLPPDGRYVLMTFDDGYYNNLRVLPVLQRHEVPAVFFISTRYVESGDAYWWDVVHRERLREGASAEEVAAEQVSLKRATHDEIHEYLVRNFGEDALRPVGDEDRPMTREELQTFAEEAWVHIGNHTADHAILTNYSVDGVEEQIMGAQEWLEDALGSRPFMISYPNGNYSDLVVEAAQRCGLDLGVTVDARLSRVPSEDGERYRLGRYCFTRGYDDEDTFLHFRAPMSLRRAASVARSVLSPRG